MKNLASLAVLVRLHDDCW